MTLTREKARELADKLGDFVFNEGLGWYVAQRRIAQEYRLTTIQLQQVVDIYEGI